jgi:hypothetical protein
MEGQQRRVVNSVEELSAAALDGLDRAEMIDREDDQFNRGSRSHKLLTVNVIRRTPSGDLYNSKIHLLDTVGVDREATKTASKPFNGKTPAERRADLKSKKPAQAEDVTVKALIRCFDSMHEKSKHIPFRDSKLTRLLKSSLESGRSIMVGCVSTTTHAESDAMLQFFHKCSSNLPPTNIHISFSQICSTFLSLSFFLSFFHILFSLYSTANEPESLCH